MPRLPGCLFKFIQKQPPKVFILLVDVRKLKSCSCKFLAKFSRKTPVCQIRVSFLKSIKKETLAQLLSCEFCEIVFHRTPLGILAAASEFCFFLLIFLSTSFSQLASQLAIYCMYSQLARQLSYSHCVCFKTQLFFMIAAAIFPVFYFLFLKLNLFPALHLCSVLPFFLGSFYRLSIVRLRC